jgi:type IX secretion system PorP/SprF family membrane protein
MKSILFFLCSCFPICLTAQQLSESSHFNNANFAYNPALTATSDVLEAHAIYRQEWTGFDQAPRNISAGLQYPIVNNNMGLGLHIAQDEVGAFQMTDIGISYAYHVPIASNQLLSIGLAVHFDQYRFKENEVIATDGSDALWVEGEDSQIQTNAGIGVSYATIGLNQFQKSYFFCSIGANQIILNDVIFSGLSEAANFRRAIHAVVLIGYRFQLDYAQIEPSLQINNVAGNITKFRFHLNYEMEDAFWVGFAIDSNVRVAFQGGVLIGEQRVGQFRIGAQVSYGTSTVTEAQGLGYSVFVGYSLWL